MKINKGSSLIGATVKNQQGETLGKIKDIVVDLSSEKVAYAVLDTGTGAFSTQKLHAVPLRAFQTDAEGTSLILNADKQKAAQAEGFDKNNWPAMNSAAWGAEPFWKESEGTTTAPRSTESDRQNRDTTKEGSKSQPQNQP
jgi:sporulation protein YlmC with PRC-barrel domain